MDTYVLVIIHVNVMHYNLTDIALKIFLLSRILRFFNAQTAYVVLDQVTYLLKISSKIYYESRSTDLL